MRVDVPNQLPDTGSPRPLIFFIGEAPSDKEFAYHCARMANENKPGFPNVGSLGHIFNSALKDLGINRFKHGVLNVFQCQIGTGTEKLATIGQTDLRDDNDGSDLWKFVLSRKLTDFGGWLRPEFDCHVRALWDTINAYKPDLLVPMGNTACWAVLGRERISEIRGAETESLFPEIPAIPTFHPALVHKQYKNLVYYRADIEKAVRRAFGTGTSSISRRILLPETVADVVGWLSAQPKQLLSCDIETTGRDVEAIGQPPVSTRRKQFITMLGFATDPSEILVVPFTNGYKANYWAPDAELAVLAAVRDILEDPEVPVLFQRGIYDADWLYETWGIRTFNYSADTILLHKALQPEMNKDLGSMVATYLNETDWKRVHKDMTGKKGG